MRQEAVVACFNAEMQRYVVVELSAARELDMQRRNPMRQSSGADGLAVVRLL